MNKHTTLPWATALLLLLMTTRFMDAGDLWNRMKSTKSEQEAQALLASLSVDAIMDLCNEYGQAVDRADEKGSPFVIGMALQEMKKRGELFQDRLLSVLSDRSKSDFWRCLCARYCADYRVIAPEGMDIVKAYDKLVVVLANGDNQEDLRAAASYACARLLLKSYYYLVLDEKGKKLSDRDLEERIRHSTLDSVLQNDGRVVAMYGLVVSGKLPDKIVSKRLSPLWNIPVIRSIPELNIEQVLSFLRKKESGSKDATEKEGFSQAIRELSKATE